jgi:extradiol dioxygenase family protein
MGGPPRLDFVPISLHHAQVFYPPGEEAKARSFYGIALGLPELERPTTLSDREGIWYGAGQGQVHLSAQSDLALHGRRHFALRVDDPDAMRARRCYCGVREAQTPSSRGRRKPPEYVFDPFGNKIELDEIRNSSEISAKR